MGEVVIDANVLFAGLLARSSKVQRAIAAPPEGIRFIAPKFVFVEVFKYKERIAAMSSLSVPELLDLFNGLLNRIDFRNEATISLPNWMRAWELCAHVDRKDLAYVALTLESGGELWTHDRELRSGLEEGGFDRFYDP